MISTQHRVPRQRIPYILRKGNQFNTDLFIVRFSENKESFSRFRTIVSTKLLKKAVDRNKLRRQIYESIRTNLDKNTKNNDYILIPKKKILRKKYLDIDQDLTSNIIN